MILDKIKAFGAFWYDFIIGDDWRVAVAVVVALTLTAILARQGSPGHWWWIPLATVVVMLPFSVYLGTRKKS